MQTKKVKSQHTVLSGNIIEIFDCDDQVCSKVLFKPGYIKINLKDLEEVHLGDEVEIECEIKVLKTVPSLGNFKNRDQ